tara:strand:- start:83959 stop:85335 length:1377 start_codon:yes stop_codon:yes gene_type:complete
MPEDLSSMQPLAELEVYLLEELLEYQEDRLAELDSGKLARTSPVVVGNFLERLNVDDRRQVLRALSEPVASEILAEMDAEDSAEVVEAMREHRALAILESLERDDAADVIGQLEDVTQERLLSKLNPKTAAEVRSLLKYGPDTAGGVMNPHVGTVRASMSVDEAIQHIRKIKEELEHIFYLYVVDDEKHLQGVLSARDLIMALPTQKVSAIMRTELKGVCKADEDREAVALAMADSNFLALPVVDTEGKLLGIVEHDDVIDIIQSEATEDFQRLVGAGPDESIHDDVFFSEKRRVPWLAVNVFTAYLAGGVIFMFRHQIEELSMLAVFIPILASLSGNTGAQTLAIAIRSLALGEMKPADNTTVCLREGFKGLISGIIIGAIGAILAYFMTDRLDLASVVFAAMAISMSLGGLAGALIPIILKNFDFDPAQSSSIFLTAVTDVTSSLIFLSLGVWFLL